MTTNLPVKCYNYRLRKLFPSFLSFEVTIVTLCWFFSGIGVSELQEIINMEYQCAKPEGHNPKANHCEKPQTPHLWVIHICAKQNQETWSNRFLFHSCTHINRATHRYCAATTTLTLLPPTHNSALYIRTRSFRFPSASSTFKTTTTSPLKNRTNG